MKNKLMLFPLFVFFLSCSTEQEQPDRIAWDNWGVPHIYADTEEDLFYAQGWAQMHQHANLVLELYGSSRGKGAEYWGAEQLENDVLIHTLGFPELAKEWTEKQDPQLKKIMTSFINGMNDYADRHPEAIKEANRQVLPVRPEDINLHSMFVVFTRFVGGSEFGMVQRWSDKGSNAYAVGPQRTASGNAMLVQNPHLPWFREFTFWESQLNLKGKKIHGATLVGFPGIAIGFNQHLGWTHTDNTLDNSDTYELSLSENGYLMDGEEKSFDIKSKSIKIKQEDGTLTDQNIDVYKSVHGPVVKKGENKALAVRMVGFDRPNAFLQWWKMANSTSLEEFESSLRMAEIPFWNVMYADKEGNIFYLFNGLVPKRSKGDWSYWSRIIPGNESDNIWSEVHSYEELPKLKNPEQHWLQNANDPPWTSTIPPSLNPEDFPPYMAPQGMSFRPQRSARMLMEDESITFEELIDYKHSTRLELADRVLDDLFAAVDASDSEPAKEAKAVLMGWDRSADADSKGMVLFYNWARKFRPWDQSQYEVQWNADAPQSTPDGIADPDQAVLLLESAAKEVEALFGSLDVSWGEYYKIDHNGKVLPANGVDGSMGVFRVAWPARMEPSEAYVGGGDSWVGVIEFGEKIKARVLLSYGNATQENSPHNGDQLQLFSEKKLRDALFYEEDLENNISRTEVKGENGFSTKND